MYHFLRITGCPTATAALLLLPALAAFTLQAQSTKPFLTFSSPEDAGFSDTGLEHIDKIFNEYIADEKLPGTVVLIVRSNKIVYHDDIFRIASQTKAITSLAAMMLSEEGKFLLDDPVSKYIPELEDQRILKTFHPEDFSFTTEPAKRQVTIRHLLTHSSGIDYPVIGSNDFKAIYARAGIPSGIGNIGSVIAEKIKAPGKLPLRHNPGERWTYGLNSDVLGYLAEIWSGMSFDDFLTTRIFAPPPGNEGHSLLSSGNQI